MQRGREQTTVGYTVVLALENILVALTTEIGDVPCFLYIKSSWIGVI